MLVKGAPDVKVASANTTHLVIEPTQNCFKLHSIKLVPWISPEKYSGMTNNLISLTIYQLTSWKYVNYEESMSVDINIQLIIRFKILTDYKIMYTWKKLAHQKLIAHCSNIMKHLTCLQNSKVIWAFQHPIWWFWGSERSNNKMYVILIWPLHIKINTEAVN